ncbi:MAG TPA: xanthine dehydrogenase family protein subunit M [Burkholderiales bacterium]|nr:xanthine dehydrogenase family protein subunit M [Burkholderiales bacterium]
MEYVEPRSLSEACDALSDERSDAKVLAGGVALSIMMRWGLVKPGRLISIRYLEELRYARVDNHQALRIGAATTHREIETSSLIREQQPALAEMERRLASVQVRNSGTLGGNLCHADSAADPAPLLLALDASVVLASVRGRRTLSLKEFFRGYLTTALAPDEILAEIVIPAQPPRSGAAYMKHSTRNAVDFPFAGVATQVSLSTDAASCAGARLAVGAVGPTPRLSESIPRLLDGRLLSEPVIGEAATAASLEVEVADDASGSAEYRRHLVAVLARRALTQAWERARAAAAPERS